MLLRHVAAASILSCVALASQAQQTALRYKAPAERVHYRVKITVDSLSEESTYQGRISYQGTMEGSNALHLTYQGGLKKSTKKKHGSHPSGPFDGPFGGRFIPPPPMSPFAQPSGPGALRQTTAKITMTPTGEVLSLEGDSQIPLPLGHLSLLVFESLPNEPKGDWTVTSGVLLGKKRQPAGGFPWDPFARPARPGKTSAGSETSQYRISKSSGSCLTIDKVYALDSPNTKPAFRMTGGGPLVFDQDRGLFVSANLKYELVLKEENVEVKTPLTVEFESLTAEQIAALEREAAEAALQAARAPYAGMSEEDIAKIYRTGGEVPPTGRTITEDMKLPKGLIIQNKWPYHNKWSVSKVIRELPDGKIEFEAVNTKKHYQRARSTLSLAPDFVEQPFVSADELAAFRRQIAGDSPPDPATAEFRTWRDATGKFSIEAKYVGMDGDNVLLRRKDNDAEIKVPRSRLSQSDRQFLSQQRGDSEGNPFE